MLEEKRVVRPNYQLFNASSIIPGVALHPEVYSFDMEIIDIPYGVKTNFLIDALYRKYFGDIPHLIMIINWIQLNLVVIKLNLTELTFSNYFMSYSSIASFLIYRTTDPPYENQKNFQKILSLIPCPGIGERIYPWMKHNINLRNSQYNLVTGQH